MNSDNEYNNYNNYNGDNGEGYDGYNNENGNDYSGYNEENGQSQNGYGGYYENQTNDYGGYNSYDNGHYGPNNGQYGQYNGQNGQYGQYNSYNQYNGQGNPNNQYNNGYNNYNYNPNFGNPNNFNAQYYDYVNQQNAAYNETIRRNTYYQMKAKNERREIRRLGNAVGITLIVTLLVQTIFVMAMQFADLTDYYYSSYLFQSSFTLIAVEICSLLLPFLLMYLSNKQKYVGDLVPTAKLGGEEVLKWTSFGMLCCVAANILVSIISSLVNTTGHELTQTETLDPSTVFECIVCLIGTAIMPAICEEFSMRCCGIGLLQKYGKGFAVVAMSLVFGLIHGNIIQFIFATLIGLILGYITVVTNNIWPAVLIHMLNNGMSVVDSILCYIFPNNSFIEDYLTLVMFAVWIILGGICTFLLYREKKLNFKLDTDGPKEPFQNNMGQKLAAFFISPGMIVPLIYLLYSLITSVS